MAEIQINKVEDILQLKDIQSMMKLFKQWGIKAPKTANKDIFVSELVKFYKENGAVAPKDRKTVRYCFFGFRPLSFMHTVYKSIVL